MDQQIQVSIVEKEKIEVSLKDVVLSVNMVSPGEIGPLGPKGDSAKLPEGLLISDPPQGCHKVINIYVNTNRKLVVDYEVFV